MNIQGRPALLLIDLQQGFDDTDYWGGHRNNPQAEENAGRLLAFWRKLRLPVFHVRHNSSNPASKLVKGKPGHEFMEVVQPLEKEPVIEKNTNSAFMGTDLQQQLAHQGIRQLVMAGMTTDHCVSSTARMAGNLGYETYVVADATATFDRVGADGRTYAAEIMHDTALASLHQEFATVIGTEDILSELQQTT